MNEKKASIRSQKDAWLIVTKWHRWILSYVGKEYTRKLRKLSSIIFDREFEDCVQVAHLAAFRAAELFDEERGFSFPTYAKYWIDQLVFTSFLRKRFTSGKFIRIINKEIEIDDNGDFACNIEDFINRNELHSSSIRGVIKSNDLLNDLFVNDKTCQDVGHEKFVSREAIRCRRNTIMKKLSFMSKEKYAL